MDNQKLPLRLRPRQVAELFGVSLPTVWRYARDGKLTRIKVSDKVTVFDTKEVIELFSNKTVNR